MAHTDRRTVAYIRVSTEDQAKEGNSLPDQERQCRAYAVARDWGDVDEVYADPGVSGATRHRPGLRRLLADAKAGTVGRVIVAKLDRMSRRAADLLAIEEEFDQYQVERIYIKDSIDTSTPVGRMLRTVLAAVAELERDMILERTTAGKMEAVRRGAVWRPQGLLGYRYLPVDKANGLTGRLEVDDATAPLIRRLFTAVASGVTLRALAAQLNKEGVPTHRGGEIWRHTTLRTIITNPAYAGQASYGRQHRVKVGKDKSVPRPADPATVTYIPIPALISPDVFEAAQAALVRNRAMAKRNAKQEYLLGGALVHCGALQPDGEVCGRAMQGFERHGRYYRCSHSEKPGYRRHSVPAGPLEERVWKALCAALENPDTLLADVEALAREGSQQAAEAAAEMAQLERAMSDVDAQAERLLDLYLEERINATAYSAKADALTAKRRALSDQQAAIAVRRDVAMARLLPVAEAKALCAEVAGRLATLTFEQKRHLIRTMITNVVVKKNVITKKDEVCIDGAFDSLSTSIPLVVGDFVDITSRCYAHQQPPPPGHA